MRATRRRSRWAALLLGFAVSFVLTAVGVLHALDGAGVEYKIVALDLMEQLSGRLRTISGQLLDGARGEEGS